MPDMRFPTDPTCREALATFETFRKLGFAASDIWFEQTVNAQGQRVLVCDLRTQGKTFGIAVGLADDATSARLHDAAEWWNAQTPGCRHCERIYEGSAIRAHSVDVLLALGAKGIVLPVTAKAAAKKTPAGPERKTAKTDGRKTAKTGGKTAKKAKTKGEK